ncbi:hypothetical protein [Oceanicoccus sp. KOV_DT_Chl]|uniref:hypothetical protein n=1 Tax=Oceanicoccus sp. KOV_DT_Chl TaxID=1904639 RepID=UPI0011AEF708|nr:hypothetical protein [Oceanicoccus sp. KOV_DT_Chl]
MKQLLIVCGMHRSGTSLISRSLSKTGLSFGSTYIADQPFINRDGFYEDKRVVAINEKILGRNKHSWWSIEPFFDHNSDVSIADIRELLKTIDEPYYAIKDPRLCLTIDLWLKAAALELITTKIVWVERCVESIALSLYRRDLLPPIISHELLAVYRDSFFVAADAHDGYLGTIHYPPHEQELDSSHDLEKWLTSLGMTSFKDAYIASYDGAENRNSASPGVFGIKEKQQILNRWKDTHELIAELEDDLKASRKVWIRKRVKHIVDKDQEWFENLEKRNLELEQALGSRIIQLESSNSQLGARINELENDLASVREENNLYKLRDLKFPWVLYLFLKRKIDRIFLRGNSD